MYENAFGFDWTRLSEDEALKRMYALGVAAVLGERHPDEYRRIMQQADTAYRRSVLELSFKEGQQRAKNNRREFADHEAVWREGSGEAQARQGGRAEGGGACARHEHGLH